MTERDILHRLTCRGKTTSLSSEPAGRSCDGCQRMPNWQLSIHLRTNGLYNGHGSVNSCAGSIMTFDIGLGTVFRAYADVKTKFSRTHWAPHARAKAALIIKLQFNYFLTFTLSVGRFSWAGKQHLLKSIAEYMFLVKSNCGLLSLYYQCCIPIGWATTRLYVIAH